MKKNAQLTNSYLSFAMGEEIYAANVSKVINILEPTKITKVPQSPAYMKGVINLRGIVLPLVDTRIKFGMEPTVFQTNTCILVLELSQGNDHFKLGALVDGVREVIEISENEIMPAPQIGNSYESEFIQGVYQNKNEEFIMILDMDKIFSTDELVHLQETQNLIPNEK